MFSSKYLHQVVADYADIFDQPVHTGMSHSWINNLSLVTLKNKGGGGWGISGWFPDTVK